MRLIRSKLTFANVVALLALFIALGGSAYAIHLGKNAVKTKNIKDAAVIESKIADGAISNAKIAAGAVSAKSLGRVVVRTASTPMPDNTIKVAIATCDPGERLIGGASGVSTSNSPDIVVVSSDATLADATAPASDQAPTSWEVLGDNYAGGDTTTAAVFSRALCLK